jgi:hypothetical protein
MESELWKKVYRTVMKFGIKTNIKWGTFSDADIAATYLWSVFNDRPANWACVKGNWPICYRRRRLPDPSTICRRLRSPSVQSLLKKLETLWQQQVPRSFCRWIDAKGLLISNSSTDRQAGYGYAGGGKGKGYKFYAIADPNQSFINWTIRPMQHKECRVAESLLSA